MKIVSIQTGKRKLYKRADKEFESSFVKTKAALPAKITVEGFDTDTQSDKRYHGGATKAVMTFSLGNYPFYQKLLNTETLEYGIFGENLTLSGIDESNVSVGSIYKIGEVVLEVSQPREPCWKVSYFLNHKDATKEMYKSGKTGWYFRVLTPGTIHEDDTITLVEKKNSDLTIENLNFLVNGKVQDEILLKKAIECPFLGEPFKKSLKKIDEKNTNY